MFEAWINKTYRSGFTPHILLTSLLTHRSWSEWRGTTFPGSSGICGIHPSYNKADWRYYIKQRNLRLFSSLFVSYGMGASLDSSLPNRWYWLIHQLYSMAMKHTLLNVSKFHNEWDMDETWSLKAHTIRRGAFHEGYIHRERKMIQSDASTKLNSVVPHMYYLPNHRSSAHSCIVLSANKKGS
jgi:hypothetical protein